MAITTTTLRLLLVAAAAAATNGEGRTRHEAVAVENVLVDVNAARGEWCCAAVLQDPNFGVASRTTTGLWPRECKWMEIFFDAENQNLDPNRDEQVLSHALPGLCAAWMALKQPGEDTLVMGRLRRPDQIAFNPRYGAQHDTFYRGVVETTIAELPGEEMLFSQLATLSMAMTECNTIHRKERHPSNWAPFCGSKEYRARGGNCDCDAILVAFARRSFASQRTAGGGGGSGAGWGGGGGGGGGGGIMENTKIKTKKTKAVASMRAAISPKEIARRLWEPGGFVYDPNTVMHHLPPLRESGKDREWGRFLMYLPLHDEEEAAVERQIAFGKAMAEGAHELAAYVAGELGKPFLFHAPPGRRQRKTNKANEQEEEEEDEDDERDSKKKKKKKKKKSSSTKRTATNTAFAPLPGHDDPLIDSPAETLLTRGGAVRRGVMRRGPEGQGQRRRRRRRRDDDDDDGGSSTGYTMGKQFDENDDDDIDEHAIAKAGTAGNLRWGSSLSWSSTLFTGKYGALWNLSLTNRVTEGKDPFFEPLQTLRAMGGDGQNNNAEEEEEEGGGEGGSRTRLCGATVTHVIRPWSECEAAVATRHEFDLFLNVGLDNVHNHYTDGVYRLNDTSCLVVLNKAIARPPAAAVLTGEDCHTWYGSARLRPSAAFFGTMNHPSPLALRVVALGVMSEHVRGYHAAATALLASYHARLRLRRSGDGDWNRDQVEEVRVLEEEEEENARLWENLRREVARLMWYVWSTAPYGRGSPTIGLLTHHAMYMALFPANEPERKKLKRKDTASGRGSRGVALMCLPRLKMGVYTDWEAMSTPSAEDFSEGTYWALWDDDARHMIGCLRRQLADTYSSGGEEVVGEATTTSGDAGESREEEGAAGVRDGSEL